MAIANTTTLAELLREHYETPFTDAMDQDIFFLNRFKRKPGVGKTVQWKVHYAGNTGMASYNESTATLPTAVAQSYKNAETAFKQNWVPIEVTGLVQAATRGQGGFMEALATETKETLENFKNFLNEQLLDINASAGADNITGFPTIVSDTGTYAGIDRSTFTWWQSYVADNGGTPRALSLTLMQAAMEALVDPSRKAKINAIYAPRGHWYDYGNLLTEYRRFVNEDKLDGGYKALDFEGIPVIAVPNMAAGSIYFVDEREWFYYVLQNFETTPKSTTKDSDYFLVTHYSELVCKHPGRQGRIDDLS